MRPPVWLCTVGLLAVLLTACTAPVPALTPTPEVSVPFTPGPTNTPPVTATPGPTVTPLPTLTHTPTITPTPLALSGGLVLFVLEDPAGPQLALVPTDRQTAPVRLPLRGRSPAVSRDGKQVAFVAQDNILQTIRVAELQGDGKSILLTAQGGINASPSWSSTGQWIAYAHRAALPAVQVYKDNWDIFISPADGSSAFNLTQSAANETDPVYAPDGLTLAYVSDASGFPEIMLYRFETKKTELITRTGKPKQDLTWSPDGTKIAFTSTDANGASDLFVVDIDSREMVGLAIDPALDSHPGWSPDGAQLVFQSNRRGTSGLYVMNAAGDWVTELTPLDVIASEPVWFNP